ncbi:helix-turn-helix transcriptional regulator [Aliiroseovarius subalbicans]|uniref:helix-turn-helix domain-containing protein n=1 Tax=Aliiroseovarius subalbicans TaxID=2925840 RepID=UPI001F5A96D9|nr:helix-turn-helix transcriptional regulator [Aliiroseovarius subalbicans]MCI2398921.1 helix-turn-helix domain-containing protein [Aliiroseovarius subalbicans]
MNHPVDAHVGRKIREARLLRGMTQADVAARLGLSFQQLQKYETGHNRVSASKLYEIALLLGVTPQHFFEGLNADEASLADLMDERTARAAQALSSITDEKVKARLHSMIHEIAGREAARA